MPGKSRTICCIIALKQLIVMKPRRLKQVAVLCGAAAYDEKLAEISYVCVQYQQSHVSKPARSHHGLQSLTDNGWVTIQQGTSLS